MRKRGRPRHAALTDIASNDEIIARTDRQLIFWGFPQKQRVFELVGKLAQRILGRTDSNGLGLGADRIKQIYQLWNLKQPFRYQRWRYTRETLRLRVPDKTASINQLAVTLLQNDGEWPEDPSGAWISHGDAIH